MQKFIALDQTVYEKSITNMFALQYFGSLGDDVQQGPLYQVAKFRRFRGRRHQHTDKYTKAQFTRYNLLSDGCQTTTGCIVYTNIQPVVKPGLTTSCILYTAGCQTGCTTRFHNRLNEQYCSFNTVVNPVVKPV